MTENPKAILLLQYAAAITGCLTVTGYGTIISWTSPALPFLESSASDIKITLNQSSWIASLYLIGFIIGFLLNPLFIDRISRKWTLMLFAIPQIISWLMIIFAKSHITLYCARLIGGAGYGGGLCAMTVYMTEIGNKENRGIFLIIIRLSMGLGFLLTMFLGAYFTYQQMNLVLLMLPILFLIIFLFMPDSSYFLEINQRIEKAKLNCVQELGLDEKSKLNCVIEKEETCSNSELSTFEKQERIHSLRETNLWKLFSNSTNRRALIIVVTTGLLNILSGQAALGAFGQQILSYKTSPMDPKKTMILLSALNAIACLVSTQIIEKINRRNILIFSGLISSLSLAIIGVYFYFEHSGFKSTTYLGWIPIIFLSVFDVLLSTGPSNIFYIYQGELFTNEVKSVAVTVVKFVYIVFGFLTVYYFQKVSKTAGMHWIFWIFGTCCGVGTILVYLMAPESRGKPLEEIQDNLTRRSLFYRIHNCFQTNNKRSI
ncbi:facilitated trehalose transporter Tret1-like [Leptopilina boulardi]|uniref:facilitated trehalose transporter Tret1-like n=1 Tax=Leptopilina boulardi TaxID=63433 RepID=UPI0021F60750|nr:facilitated trehalose transporter Tret1-like [Leptopilina boulardi]XP_051159710.1 facilitated trehalose transporter Tret1-like [Leptopilina boulardi]